MENQEQDGSLGMAANVNNSNKEQDFLRSMRLQSLRDAVDIDITGDSERILENAEEFYKYLIK